MGSVVFSDLEQNKCQCANRLEILWRNQDYATKSLQKK